MSSETMPNNPNQDSESLLPSDERAKKERSLGARILSKIGFQDHQKNIVESSFSKAQKSGEKLPGKNAERRNYSYLSRLENLVEKHGNKLEKKLWQASTNRLIIKPENIEDSYWKSQEQILRDNGQGRELSDYEKDYLTADIQKAQKESLESWSNYLGDENSPYPMWFKVYAWDGVSKMGVFNKDKHHFDKRNEHTVAPFPKLNPAVLAKVHSTIEDFYNHTDKERYEENNERNEELEALVQSGNFNKLYSKILLSEKAIPKTPERTEDVHGEWVEYLPGQEESLANAAEGTPWCVADPGTGRNYLEYGNYSGYDDDYDDYDDYDGYEDDEYNENKAKFILFHLYDPETNQLAENACASIRLNPEGRVAEISGLNDGQALEDSLVPIVEEKVKSLPGGEDFLEAFADKQKLIELDHKMQNGEDLTKEELEFIYEINRPIKTLDTYNQEDPRIEELKDKYSIEYALDKGIIDVDNLVSRLNADDIVDNLDALVSHNINIDELIADRQHDIVFDPDTFSNFLDKLSYCNVDIDHIVSMIDYFYIAYNLDIIISRGIDIDIDNLVSKLDSSEISYTLDTLLECGANINDLISRLDSEDTADNLDTLLSHGANVNTILEKLSEDQKQKNKDLLNQYGANIS